MRGAVLRDARAESNRRCFMKTLIVIALPILASAAFAFDNSSHVAKSTMNCSDHNCCRPTHQRSAVARIPQVTADPGAELRYRMKYGRNPPAEEARQKAAQDYSKNTADRAEEGCCSGLRAKPVTVETPMATADPGAEMRYRMKYGRNTPAEERRQKAAQDYASNAGDRAEESCCSELRAKPVTSETPVATADPGAELRFRMKYGRNTPAEERRQAGRSENMERMLLASAERMMCSADCCKHER